MERGAMESVSLRSQITRCAVPNKQPCFVDENPVEAAARRECETAQNNDDRNSGWSVLPDDTQEFILAKLNYEHLFQAKAVSKLFKARIEGDGFNCFRGSLHLREGLLTALHFFVRHDGVWRCAGYDLDTKAWRKLPPFAMLPRLDTTLFKNHSICGARGLLCVHVSAMSSPAFQEKMVLLNPLTGRWRELPPLNHPRNPVLMHMVVAPTGDSLKIIAAGSARVGDEHLSKITEVFDSRTSMWTVTGDLPGPVFALNEHQNGAYMNGILYCVAFFTPFLDGDRGRGLLAYGVDEGKWLSHLACPQPNATNLNIMQVANINGEVVVFSEIEHNPYNPARTVEHCIDILENLYSGQGTTGGTRGQWRNVMTQTKVGSRAGLQIYPDHTCVPFGKGKLCIFDTIAHTGDIYDMESGKCIENLSAPTWNGSGEKNFYSFNPPTFSFEPSFKGNPKLKLAHGSSKRVHPFKERSNSFGTLELEFRNIVLLIVVEFALRSYPRR